MTTCSTCGMATKQVCSVCGEACDMHDNASHTHGTEPAGASCVSKCTGCDMPEVDCDCPKVDTAPTTDNSDTAPGEM